MGFLSRLSTSWLLVVGALPLTLDRPIFKRKVAVAQVAIGLLYRESLQGEELQRKVFCLPVLIHL